jgi:hypothetical protein
MGSEPRATVANALYLNVHPDVFCEQFRTAGVDHGTLFNRWLKCPWTVTPAIGTAAYRWTAEFFALDDGTKQSFSGVAGNRALGQGAAFDAITRRIQACVEHRKRWMNRYNAAQLQSLAAGVPVAG